MSEQPRKDSKSENPDDDIYAEPKARPKIIRILTVFAYMSSVSMAAILLSIYYIFMWDGRPTLARSSAPKMEPMVDYPPKTSQHYHEDYLEDQIRPTDKMFEQILIENVQKNKSDLNQGILEKLINASIKEKAGNVIEIEEEVVTTKSDQHENPNSEQTHLQQTLKQELVSTRSTDATKIQTTTESILEGTTPEKITEDRDVEQVEKELESANLPEPERTNSGILANNKFFYKKLIVT